MLHYLYTPKGLVGGLNTINCQTRSRLCVIFGVFCFGVSELLPKKEQEAVKRRVLMAQQAIFAGAEFNF